MLQQIQLFATQHMVLVLMGLWLFARATYALPEPLPGSRWYRMLYILLHEIAANADRAASARGWTPPGTVLALPAVQPQVNQNTVPVAAAAAAPSVPGVNQ